MENYTSLQISILFWVQIIMCISTTAAVIIALWQTKYPFKKNIEVKFAFSKNQYMVNIEKTELFDNKQICIFQAYNIGNMSVNIVEFGLADNKKRTIIPLTNSRSGVAEKVKMPETITLPLNLNSQEHVEFFYDLEFIKSYIERTQYSNKKDCKKIWAYFKNSVGKYTYTKISKRKHHEVYEAIINSLENDKSTYNIITRFFNLVKSYSKKIVAVKVDTYDNKKGYGTATLETGGVIPIKKEIIVRKRGLIKPGEMIDIYI